MRNFKSKMGKFTITLLLVLSFIGLPMITLAEEEIPTPTETPTPTPTEVPTPTPTEAPVPTPTTTPEPTPTEKPTEKKSIRLDKTNVEAVPGAAVNIKATVTGVENAKIKWSSSNSAVATVNNGVVKTLKPGNVIITATLEDDSSVSAQCSITITTKDNETSTSSKEEKDDKDKNKDKEKESLNLKSLKVKGYTLNEPFSSNRTGYTVDIPYEAEDVIIEVEKQSNNVKTEIKGATNLKVGRNTVTVTVKDDAGNSKVYTITVIRATKEEKVIKKNPTSHVVSQVSSSLKPVSTRKNHTLEYVFVTIGCLILFAIGGLGIYFFIKTSGKDKQKKKEKKERTIKKESKAKKIEEKVETPMVEVSSNQDDELGKTIEIKEEIQKVEKKQETPTNLKQESAILKEVEDLFDDE